MMHVTLHTLLSFAGAILCSGLAIFVLYDNRSSFVHQTFALGMMVLAVMEGCSGVSLHAAPYIPTVLDWKHANWIATSFFPGLWFLFSLSFARTNYREILAKWRYVIVAMFVVPVSLVLFCHDALFQEGQYLDLSFTIVLPLGWAGYSFSLFLLLSSVLILMHLEQTLRAFTGSTRWQIKFVVLGIGTLFAGQIYTNSQILLFSAIHVSAEFANAYAVLIANALLLLAFARNRHFNVTISLSRTVVQHSITVLTVGVYLVAVGLLTKGIRYFGGDLNLTLGTFFVFVALVGLTALLLSDELRFHVKRFVSRHFYHSHYDYRREWIAFTQQTATVMHAKELCRVVCKKAADTFGVPSVTIWLHDEDPWEQMVVGGSTVFSEDMPWPPPGMEAATQALIAYMRDQLTPVDFAHASPPHANTFPHSYGEFLRTNRIRYCVAFVAGKQLLGLMALGERYSKEDFTLEDMDLLKMIADQTAAYLLNLQLSQHLLRAKQLETFQTMSAFFVHDLKNLASKLSLTVQNLPHYYDNPAFRDDTLRVLSASVTKMNAMCSRLSLLTRKLELQQSETDLNELVRQTLLELHGTTKTVIHHDLRNIPKAFVDPEQFQKVLMNLVLNACEAVGTEGKVCVETTQAQGRILLTVHDNGCGMSEAFMKHSLFHPFQTTKDHGLGIGLFHSRTIVEAHQGHIEVESLEGKGSTFRISLPLTHTVSEVA